MNDEKTPCAVKKMGDTANVLFETYLMMGPGRTLENLRRDYGIKDVSLNQLNRWSVTYDWARRCKDHDSHMEAIQARTLKWKIDVMAQNYLPVSGAVKELSRDYLRLSTLLDEIKMRLSIPSPVITRLHFSEKSELQRLVLSIQNRSRVVFLPEIPEGFLSTLSVNDDDDYFFDDDELF